MKKILELIKKFFASNRKLSVLSVMGEYSGDDKIYWDPKRKSSITHAKKRFDEAIKKGAAAFSVGEDGKKDKKITKFDSKAGEIIIIGRMAGGSNAS